jgi:Flp pilus assembly protein TadG
MRMGDQAGSAAVEAVVVVPVFMVAVLVALQLAIWAHAEHVVEAAAARGDAVAQELGSTPGAGREAAVEMLEVSGKNLVGRTVVSETLAGDQAVVAVQGNAQSILPWLDLPVSATSIGPLQEFRTSG